MKKRTVISLIVAAILIVFGGVLVLLGLSYAGSNKDEVVSVQNARAVPVQDIFDSIRIDTNDCDVTFALLEDGADPYILFQEQDNVHHDVAIEDKTLNIQMIDQRRWYDHIGIFHVFGMPKTMEMTVYLPQKQYSFIQIRTDTGDIAIPQMFAVTEMTLRSDTGDISCMGTNGDVLDCMTSTGDIAVQCGTLTSVKLQSDTGDLSASVFACDEMHLKTNTGEVDVLNVTAQGFTCSTDTGDVELEQVLTTDYLQIRTATGDVEVDDCDAGRVDIETDTGDVSGHFLTAKWFSASSNTGRVSVPDTKEGGDCRIKTDTGSIRFE